MATALRRPRCYLVTREARAPAMCGAGQRDPKVKGHIHGVPGAGRPRPRHPTPPGPPEERRRWQRDPGAAGERGERRPRPPNHAATGSGRRSESLARQHGRNLGSACSQGSCSTAGPGRTPHSARPGLGGRGRPCRHSAAPGPSRRNEPAGARQCCHARGEAAAALPGPAERPPDSPAPPAPPGSPSPPPSRHRRPRPRHPARTALQRLIGQRRFLRHRAGRGPVANVREGGATVPHTPKPGAAAGRV